MNVESLKFFLKNFNHLSNNNLILTKNEFLVHLKYWSQTKDHFLTTLLISVPTSSTYLPACTDVEAKSGFFVWVYLGKKALHHTVDMEHETRSHEMFYLFIIY